MNCCWYLWLGCARARLTPPERRDCWRKCHLLTSVQVGSFAQTVRNWGKVVIKSWFPKRNEERDCLKLHQQWWTVLRLRPWGRILAGAGVLVDVLQALPLDAESWR